jgi:hypothetical protein
MTRSRIAAIGATCVMALGVGASSAGAATTQQGLVNVSLENIQVPIGIAANVCNVGANALASQNFTDFGDCTAIAESDAGGGGGGSNTHQRGLVNVSASDIEIPISVAANVCNVAVNLLAAGNFSDFGDCTAISEATT